MKIPKWMEKSAIKSAKYREISNNENNKIREWLDENNLTNSLGVMDALIDSIELTNNPEEFINYLKKYNKEDES